MTYLLIGLVLVLIIAPIVSILPSRSQKQIMQIRQTMMGRGVSIELTEIDDPEPNQAKYQTSTGRQLAAKLKVTMYKKTTTNREASQRVAAWRVTCDFKSDPKMPQFQPVSSSAIPAKAESLLQSRAVDLPESTAQIAWDGKTLAVFWVEQASSELAEKVFTFLDEGLQCLVTSDKD